jgi:hypothetical protein
MTAQLVLSTTAFIWKVADSIVTWQEKEIGTKVDVR